MYHLITKEGCIWCERAKALFKERGEDFVVYDHKEHPMIMKLMLEVCPKRFPQIWYNGTYIGTYENLVKWFEEL
jgi:glutaredoxin